jgi:hypothetical protein
LQDGNGNIDAEELCQAIEDMVEAEKQNRLLKKLVIVAGVLSLLAVVAVVGLTAAVVVLTKEVKDDNGALVSKSTGRPMSTTANLLDNSMRTIIDNPTPQALAGLYTITLPGASESEYSVHYVDAYFVNADGSITMKTSGGQNLRFSADPESAVGVIVVDDSTGQEVSARRKLQAANVDPCSGCLCKNGAMSPLSKCTKQGCTLYCGIGIIG